MDWKTLLATVAVCTMTSGCFCSFADCGMEAEVADADTMRMEQATNRAEDAALRAEGAADKAEAIFHRGLQK